MKNSRLTYFNYEWKKYLLALIVIFMFWFWLTDIIVRPKNTERLNIFINDEALLSFNLYDELIVLESIKEVNIYYANYQDTNYNEQFAAKAIIDTDILILKVGTFNDAETFNFAKKISIDTLFFNQNIKFYYINDIAYGIYLNENHIIIFNNTSKNLGLLNPTNYQSDVAIKAVEKILEFKNVEKEN